MELIIYKVIQCQMEQLIPFQRASCFKQSATHQDETLAHISIPTQTDPKLSVSPKSL